MSVIRFGPISGYETSLGRITEGKAIARWRAVTDNRLDREPVVAAYGYDNFILPSPYLSYHPDNPLLLCRSIVFRQARNAPCSWEIEAQYSSEPLRGGDDQQPEDPTDKPATAHWRSKLYRAPVVQDKDGHAIINSAGDYFDPPPEDDFPNWTVTIQKNVAAIPTSIINFAGAVNESSFYLQNVYVGPRVAKVMDLDIPPHAFQNDILFFPVTYQLEFKAETWDLTPLQQGWNYKDGTDRKQIVTDDTPPRPVSTQRLLDSSGALLTNPSLSTAVYGNFRRARELDLTNLPGLSELASV